MCEKGRPKKKRFLSSLIRENCFSPKKGFLKNKTRNLKGDELEAMRLCSMENLHHVSAAKKMGVSRRTLERILYSGRNKVTEALIHGTSINITFPEYISFKPTPSQGMRFKNKKPACRQAGR